MENDELKFSWSLLLLVTGICFLAFSQGLKWLDGKHPVQLLYIGFIGLGLGLLLELGKWILRNFTDDD